MWFLINVGTFLKYSYIFFRRKSAAAVEGQAIRSSRRKKIRIASARQAPCTLEEITLWTTLVDGRTWTTTPSRKTIIVSIHWP